jgi:hypothetical protein
MNMRIAVPDRLARTHERRGRSSHHERVGGEGRIAARTEGERDERSDYWLKHCEGFQVSGPDGRIGSVALVLSSDEGVDGLLVRTGLLRARTVFVPLDKVGSVTPRRRRVELVITPDSLRAPISHIVRVLGAPSGSSSGLVGTGERDRR